VNSRGFTLLELLIVVIIMVVTVSTVMPRAQGPEGRLKASVRRFNVLTRELHDKARLQNATYRIVIDLKDGKDQKYWIERSFRPVTVPSLEQIEKNAKKTDEERAKIRQESGFDIDKKFFKEPESLPNGLRFEKIERPNEKETSTEGLTAIYFFPQGAAEEAIIHLVAGEKLHWSLVIQPLLGKADIFDKPIGFSELKVK
jgi:prepilin-type N-terminal cleavage/methylation domain-containing protein